MFKLILFCSVFVLAVSLPQTFDIKKFKVGIEYAHSLPMSGGSERFRHRNNLDPFYVTVTATAKNGYVITYLELTTTTDANGIVDFTVVRGQTGSKTMVFHLASNQTDFLTYSYLVYGIREEEYKKTIFRPPGKIRSLLRSTKDPDPFSVPGVYRIPCGCGRSYIGETRHNIRTRISEHISRVKNMGTNGSAIAEHVHHSGTNHYIRFDKASVLSREKFLVPRKIWEAIEIGRYADFNRDGGWTLLPAWKLIFDTTGSYEDRFESDTISVECTNFIRVSDNEDQSDREHFEEARPPLLPCQLATSNYDFITGNIEYGSFKNWQELELEMMVSE